MAVAFRATGGADGGTTAAAGGAATGFEGTALAVAGGNETGERGIGTGAGKGAGKGRLTGAEGATSRTRGVETPPTALPPVIVDDPAGDDRGNAGAAMLPVAGGGAVRGWGTADAAGVAGADGTGERTGAAGWGVAGKEAEGGAVFRLRVNSLPLGDRGVGGFWASADVAERRATIEQAAIFMTISSRLTF